MKPIMREKLSDIIFDQLLEMIKAGEYVEGEKLPSEKDLAKYFNVSRVPIREAMSKLAQIGYIESHQGKGSYIRSITASDEFKEYTYGEFNKKELFDLLEMRTLLEVEAAKISALRRDKDSLKEIESALLDFKEITQNQFSIGHKADYNFHKAIVKSTNNDYIIQTFNNLQLVHQNALEFSLKLNIGKPRKREEVYKEHEEIYNAILTQDENEAKKRMEIHLINMRKKLGDERV